MVVSKLVTNAVSHTLPPVVLHLGASHTGERVQVVSMTAARRPALAFGQRTGPQEHDRGTLIVAALT